MLLLSKIGDPGFLVVCLLVVGFVCFFFQFLRSGFAASLDTYALFVNTLCVGGVQPNGVGHSWGYRTADTEFQI